ncbi:MFS transporter [Streptomyces sp. G45]|uniref:MFS transporter n=1 Tax=Streptomyces sp. G45 TaxID=3406627 RepID=UPI003C13B193
MSTTAPPDHGLRTAWMMTASGWSANQFSSLLGAYRSEQGLSESAVTGLFAVYVVGLIPGLLVAGPLADRRGRRRIALGALALNLLSTVVFVLGAVVPGLLLPGRFLTGVSAGALLAAGSAWIKELSGGVPGAGRRAGLFVSGGFASGGLVAAVIAQWAPVPLVTAYVPHVLLAAVALALARSAPESLGGALSHPPTRAGLASPGGALSHPPARAALASPGGPLARGAAAGLGGAPSHPPTPAGLASPGGPPARGAAAGSAGVAATAAGVSHPPTRAGAAASGGPLARGASRGWFRRSVLPVAPWVFAAPTVGFVTLPGLVHGGLLYAGVATSVVPGTGLLVQPVARRLVRPLANAVVGLLAIAFGLVLATLAAHAESWPLALGAAAALGGGYGFVLTHCLGEVAALAPPHRLARLTAYFWAAAYAGMFVPYGITLLSQAGALTPPQILATGAALAVATAAVLVGPAARGGRWRRL